MRIKDLFVVPKGQKITEKYLYQVLAVSICGILLCMGCLAGATWAWFTVSVENPGNVIQIGTPEVIVYVNNTVVKSGDNLQKGTNNVIIERANKGKDMFSYQSALYVKLTVDGNSYGYTIDSQQDAYKTQIVINAQKDCKLSWKAYWCPPPESVLMPSDTTITVEEAGPEDSTELVADPADSTPEETDASETTEPTGTETEPTAGSTEPSSGESEPEQGSEGATEGSSAENGT